MKDLTQIDGVAVIERTRAKMHNMGIERLNDTKINTVDEVLLADERVVYQCVHTDAPDCTYFAGSSKSVTAHQRSHGRSALRRELKARDAELEKINTRAEEIRQNRVNGARRAAQRKATQRLSLPSEVGHPKAEPTTDLEVASRRVVTAYNAMQDAADEFQRAFLGYMRIAATVSAPTPTPIDPELIAKAEKWDKYIEFQRFVQGNGAAPAPTTERRTRRASR